MIATATRQTREMARRAVISGGGTGIGRAIAARLLADGDEVVLVGRREQVLQAACEELRAGAATSGDQIRYEVADLRHPADVERAASAITERGDVDVLVANAGGNFNTDRAGLSGVVEDWTANFEGNVLTTVLLTESLLPAITRPGGRIVFVGSVAGVRGASSYGAAKAAVHNWSLWLGTKLAADGVTVNSVAPGFVPDTEFWAGWSADDIAGRAASIPVGRPGALEEIAELVAHLASPLAGFTTGQIVQINGGVVLGRG
ncbi:SDR family oxidoreductase [soil metagenome]